MTGDKKKDGDKHPRPPISEAELIALASGRNLAVLKELYRARGNVLDLDHIIVGIPAELFSVQVGEEISQVRVRPYEQQ